MRVRYGKPIKAKSLTGNQTSFSYISPITGGNYTAVGKNVYTQDAVFADIATQNQFHVAVADNHVILAGLIVSETNANTLNIGLVANQGGDIWQWSLDNYKEKLLCLKTYRIEGSNNEINSVYCSYGIKCTPTSFFLLDLTDVFGAGNEPTSEQFYNKYKNQLEAIAIGNEVVIDSKAGKTPLCPRLPIGYQEVEYVESTGTQWIDTGLIGQSGYTLEGEVLYNEISTGKYQYFAGFSYTGSANRVYYFRLNNSSPAYGYTYGPDNSTTTNLFTMSANTWYKCKAVMIDGNQQCWVDDILRGTSSFSLSGVDVTNPKYIYMFTSQYVDGINGTTSCKCKYAKWYFNGQLVRNFVPCYRKSDNVIGLYDLVGRQFYTNQGTGTFLKGNNVSSNVSCSPIVPTYGYNQKISNSDFSQGSYDWCYNNNAGTYSIENNVLTFTRTGGENAYNILYKSYEQLTLTANHKYLLSLKMCASAPCKIRFYTFTGSADFNLTTTMTQYQAIGTVVDRYFTFTNVTGGPAIGDSISFKDINFFDLTDWFGVGKEPTVSSEFRQKFSKDNYGYCPTPIMLTERQINALPLYGYNQLEYVANTTTTTNGITINRDSSTGVYTLNGTSTVSSMTFLVIGTKGYNNTTATRSGHKMLLLYEYLGGTISGDSNAIFLSYSGGALGDNNIRSTYQQFTAKIVTHSSTMSMGTFGTYIYANRKYDNWKFRLSTIDLTDWFGEDNEPTIDQFRSVFPYTYYGYCFDSKLNRYQINALAAK